MPTTRTQKARDAAETVSSNEYVRRLVEDEELRDSIRDAFDASKSAYGRIQKQKHPARAVMDDKKTQRELREAAESLREASDRLRGKKKERFGARQADRPRHRRRYRGDRPLRGHSQGSA